MDGLAAIIPAAAWEALTRAGVRKSFAPGQVLLRQGDPVDHVLVVTSGRTKVTRVDHEGNTLVLAVRGPGEVLGEIGTAVDGGERSATVTAIDDCVTRVVPRAAFGDLVHRLHLEKDLLRHVVRRMREGEELRSELVAFPSGVRVARGLLRLAGWHADRPWPVRAAGHVDIGLDQADLGHAVGLHRSTVAEELRKLRTRGIVATSRSRILILDHEGLQAAAQL
jgi:CRP/FNR family cyclic AMP-dependent transcriptional regulator